MADATARVKPLVTADASAAVEATNFIIAHGARLNEDEVLLERFQDIKEHNQMFILLKTPGREQHYSIEPSYQLLELMADLA